MCKIFRQLEFARILHYGLQAKSRLLPNPWLKYVTRLFQCKAYNPSAAAIRAIKVIET